MKTNLFSPTGIEIGIPKWNFSKKSEFKKFPHRQIHSTMLFSGMCNYCISKEVNQNQNRSWLRFWSSSCNILLSSTLLRGENPYLKTCKIHPKGRQYFYWSNKDRCWRPKPDKTLSNQSWWCRQYLIILCFKTLSGQNTPQTGWWTYDSYVKVWLTQRRQSVPQIALNYCNLFRK